MKLLRYLIAINTLLFLVVPNIISQSAAPKEDLPHVKGLFLDLGWGPAELGIGAGVRYWMFSGELWLGGLSVNTPNYAMQSPPGELISAGQPLPNGYEEESFTTTVIGFDAGFHYDFTPYWSAFAQVGFYSATDTVLARNISDNVYYRYRHETESGIAFGLGAEYAVSEQIVVGAGYHTRRGGFLRFTYQWW